MAELETGQFYSPSVRGFSLSYLLHSGERTEEVKIITMRPDDSEGWQPVEPYPEAPSPGNEAELSQRYDNDTSVLNRNLGEKVLRLV